MSKVKKIEEQQLTELNRIVNTLRFVSNKIAELSVEHSLAVDAHKDLQKALEEQKTSIRDQYGDVDIDLSTGEIKESEEKE